MLNNEVLLLSWDSEFGVQNSMINFELTVMALGEVQPQWHKSFMIFF